MEHLNEMKIKLYTSFGFQIRVELISSRAVLVIE